MTTILYFVKKSKPVKKHSCLLPSFNKENGMGFGNGSICMCDTCFQFYIYKNHWKKISVRKAKKLFLKLGLTA